MVGFGLSGFNFLTILLLGLHCFVGFGSVSQLLPEAEVQALTAIATKQHIDFWNVSQSSCGGGLNKTVVATKIFSNVTCDCSQSNGSVCHIATIRLERMNLSGTIPDEFANLPLLQELDLNRNYLNGSIPSSLSKLPLVILILFGNRLSGSIPTEIGNIATLEDLNLEDNLLSGPLPPSLGNLSRLKRALLSANNFNGTIPETFGNLKNLTDFMIDGNVISGKIPDFIGNWTKINKLYMQGTAMRGPIPSSISLLTNMTELRISDLSGSSTFPNLTKITQLQRLILRNCSIPGPIPLYILAMSALTELDLSFNKLTGELPQTLQSFELKGLNYMFLANNSLTGAIPDWIIYSKYKIDVSYNNFSKSPSSGCQTSPINLVSSLSSSASNSDDWCKKKGLPCSGDPKYHSLFINCGGDRTSFEGNTYEADTASGDQPTFFASAEQWAFSSTGLFMDNQYARFLATNTFSLYITGTDLYKTARLAPVSLKYYGLCMRKGSYKVRLYFAEIMYSDDQTFNSLGRRIFDVAIQGSVVLKDFNIMDIAKGAGKGIFQDFDNVIVNGSTLEIHLYWSGRGTTAIPDRGVYGPLISAIAVTPNFKVDTGGLSVGAIVGIVVGVCAAVLLVLLVLWKTGYLCAKDLVDKELRGLDLQTGYYSLRQIKASTGNFDPANKIGEGGFGPVYKGVLSDGTAIAVKQLSAKSRQGNREFVNEIGMISALQHPNLVKLFGCCAEGNQLLLIYEYMENNSLARALYGSEEQCLNLDWPRRKKICSGIATGLAYIHEESRLKIVHRDIKSTNVLLDKDLNAKISDFGLAKLNEEENSHISTRIAGTIGYMAPEYAMRGYLTDKADVYSFGVVTLEIVSGKSNTSYRPKQEFVYLLDWAYVLQEQGNLLDLVDPVLGSKYSKTEALRLLQISLLCSNPSPTLRPSMSSVVSMLNGKDPVQAPPVIKHDSMDQEARFKAFEVQSHDSQTSTATFSQKTPTQKSLSMGCPWMDSTVSVHEIDETPSQTPTRRLLPEVID